MAISKDIIDKLTIKNFFSINQINLKEKKELKRQC
jgi:hypothetical protein